ncbi:MAG: hypothetical protein MPW16_11185 [Candidatus Manganitrophus sp.]|nr:MAG: hypothetical protein MPW16_11185 [Candidatus Manganitrophus sp.]
MQMTAVSTSWVHFMPIVEVPIGFTPGETNRLDRYLIREAHSVRGDAPAVLRRGTGMARIESESPIQFSGGYREPSEGFPLRGVVQHLHYTSRSEQTELKTISRPELAASAETLAVLIPIGKSDGWWAMSQDERQILFKKTDRHEGHHGIGRRYADRIFRRLYHTRYVDPSAPYDFLTYFEFHESDAPEFRKMLTELRDVKKNPEWLYVDFEYEVWMTKLSLSTDPV